MGHPSSNLTLSIPTEVDHVMAAPQSPQAERRRRRRKHNACHGLAGEEKPAWARAALGCAAISLGLFLRPQAQQDSDTEVLAAATGQKSTGGNEQERCLQSQHPTAWLWTSQSHRVLHTG